jgi:hypothetical protein
MKASIIMIKFVSVVEHEKIRRFINILQESHLMQCYGFQESPCILHRREWPNDAKCKLKVGNKKVSQ